MDDTEFQPFNGAVRSADSDILSYPPPQELDLFAYYHNPRTEYLARQSPGKVFWSVGLEFLNSGQQESNLYAINRDVSQIFQFISKGSLDQVHIMIALADRDNFKEVLRRSYEALKRGGQLITVDVKKNPHNRKKLQHIGFATSTHAFENYDLKSDWISRHDYSGDIEKVIAMK